MAVSPVTAMRAVAAVLLIRMAVVPGGGPGMMRKGDAVSTCCCYRCCFSLLPRAPLKAEVFDEALHLGVLLVGAGGHGLELHLQMADTRVCFVEFVFLGACFGAGVTEGGGDLTVGGLVAG
jgi:hypothetical protein